MGPYFFNSPAYLELEADRLGGTPIQLSTDEGAEIGLILRHIPGSTLRDGVSVYGYPDLDQRTPLATLVEPDRILEAIRGAPALEGVVSAYFRLGLDQDVQSPRNPRLARKVLVGEVVAVDLQRDWDQIFSGFQPTLRARFRKNSNTMDVSPSDDIAAFHALYTENMIRVAAAETYFFSLDYLRKLLRLPGVDLFLATDGAGPLAGALLVSHGDLLFYHLGASSERGLARSALKVVLSTIMREHAGGRFRRLILGGGRGGESDSLLSFKRSFSSETQPAYSLRAVLDSQSYAALSRSGNERDPFDGFFPAYRDSLRLEKV